MKNHGQHYDYNVRQWIIDSAIALNRKGTKVERIISDAEIIYGFVFPENGNVSLVDAKDKGQKNER